MATFALLTLLTGRLPAQTPGAQDYQVEAVFLFNFTQFVAWPPDAFADARSPFVIGLLGDDPFGAYLDETVRGETIDARPLVVRRYRRLEDIDNCQVLFISRSEAARLNSILAQLKGRALLTVSDAEHFIREGGIVRFVTANNRVTLRINTDAAKTARLMISSKLLRVAEIISTTGIE